MWRILCGKSVIANAMFHSVIAHQETKDGFWASCFINPKYWETGSMRAGSYIEESADYGIYIPPRLGRKIE